MISNQELVKERQYFKILWRYVKREKRNLYLTILSLVITTVLTIAAPVFFNSALEIIEEVSRTQVQSGLFTAVVSALVFYFLLTVLAWFTDVSITIFSTRMNAGVIRDLRQDTFEAVLRNDMTFFDANESGNLVSILTSDLNELYETGAAIAQVITALLQLLGILVVLLFFSVPLTLTALSILPFFFVVTLLIRRYRRNAERSWRKSFGDVNQSFAETLRSITVSKAFHREEENVSNFRKLNETTYDASIRRGAAIFISQPVGDFLRNILLIAILAVGSFLVAENDLSVANYYLFVFLLDYYYQPVRAVARNYTRFQSLFANLERVLQIAFSLGEENKEVSVQESMDHLEDRIEFKDVTFSYDGEITVLDGINFEISKGERVALVGHTGSGKTTLASLITRLYPINSGEILIDGKPHWAYDVSTLRSKISIVSQDVLLFKGTIRDNLQLADQNVTDEEIWEAIDAVQAREFIELLPDGLSTMIDEDAKNLSTGQRQMLAFARTILSRPEVIILDEATSSVDLYTEAKIQEATDLLLEDTTSLVIAHRLTTIIRSDVIIVLNDGRIVEKGTHDELLALNGEYKEMYDLYFQTQSAHYLDTIKTK